MSSRAAPHTVIPSAARNLLFGVNSATRGGICCFAVLTLIGCTRADAQSLDDRVTRSDGRVQIVFPSREQLCGDGRGSIGHLLRPDHDDFVGTFNGHDYRRECLHGPGRIVATIARGAVTRIKAYVGPVPPPESGVTDLGTVSAEDARAWLLNVARRGSASPAKEAIVPLLIPDAPLPWAELYALARDGDRPREVRREATFWLAQGASSVLDPDGDASEADDVKKSAVFALSQQPRDTAVPMLISVANGNAAPSVRASALFWLGQTGDERGLPIFARVLGIR
jgi:hypothetical protein